MKKLMFILFLCFTYSVSAQQIDSCEYWKHKCDTLNHKNFILASQVNWVQKYLSIFIAHPNDLVYTKGWLTRSIASKLPANPYIAKKKKK